MKTITIFDRVRFAVHMFHKPNIWEAPDSDLMVYHVIGRILFPGANCYRPQRSCGQGNILHLSVILFTGGCLPQCMLGYHTPPGAGTPGADIPQSRHPSGADTLVEQTHPQSRHPPEQTPTWSRHPTEQTPPRSRHPQSSPPLSRHPPGSRHPPPGSRLRHTVNERPVRILLECILVNIYFTQSN